MRLSQPLIALAVLGAVFAGPAAAQTNGPFVTGEVLVKFRPGTAAGAAADAHRQAGGTQLAEIARTGVRRVAVAAGDEAAAIARYRSNPNVLYAEPNYIRSIPRPLNHQAGSEVVARDYYFDEQWALHNTGQMFYCLPWIEGEICFYIGTPDADIDAPEAWAMSTGSSAVRVAVIDSGIDYTNPDLVANYVGGWDFLNADGDPMDDHGHGTHVAGTIAAVLNNLTGTPGAEEGVVGVAPDTSILAYKVCGPDGSCSDFAIAQAVAQAIQDGAKVINMSLGSTQFSQVMYEAVQDAWIEGLVVVAGAGNNGNTQHFYPAAHENVVSVAAFDEDHLRASFSNYGNWVDVSAPGNVIMSTYPMSGCGGFSTVPGDTGCYTWMSGTSMATPHVSGAAALLWARSDVLTNSQVVDILLQSADPRGVAKTRLDSWTIHGGLNVHDAMSYGVTNLPPTANAGTDQAVIDSDGDGGEWVTLDGSASSDPDGTIVSHEWREGGTLVTTGATPDVWLSVGTHTLMLEVTDDDLATGTDTVVVTVDPANWTPVASNVSATTVVGTPVAVTLMATDVETCELVFSVVTGPASGGLGPIGNQTCVAGNPHRDTASITYTPGATAGTYSFSYVANDGSTDSNVATVTITVEDPAPPPPPPPGVTVTGISPNVVSRNAGNVTFVITGTGFADGASVAFVNGTGAAPRVLGVAWNSATQLTITAEIRSGGPQRNRVWDVQVTNPDGTTGLGVGLLTITP